VKRKVRCCLLREIPNDDVPILPFSPLPGSTRGTVLTTYDLVVLHASCRLSLPPPSSSHASFPLLRSSCSSPGSTTTTSITTNDSKSVLTQSMEKIKAGASGLERISTTRKCVRMTFDRASSFSPDCRLSRIADVLSLIFHRLVCRMPKSSTFNHLSSSLSRHLALHPSSLLAPPLIPPTHILTLHLLYEIMLFSYDKELSRWSGYLQSLPRTPPPLAMLWPDFCDEDGRKAWDIVRGGEVERRIEKDEQGLGGWAYEEGDDGGRVEWGAGGIVRSHVASVAQTAVDDRLTDHAYLDSASSTEILHRHHPTGPSNLAALVFYGNLRFSFLRNFPACVHTGLFESLPHRRLPHSRACPTCRSVRLRSPSLSFSLI
jgi:hypothetical protein